MSEESNTTITYTCNLCEEEIDDVGRDNPYEKKDKFGIKKHLCKECINEIIDNNLECSTCGDDLTEKPLCHDCKH